MSGFVKAKKYDVADSNIALLGSDLEKTVRLNASQGEDAWKNAGKQIGIEIWRIEKFKVVAWPKDQYGSFFSGDSYIILRTYKKTPDDQKLSFDVHFWLGKETSQDEAGTAAYKTVELDDCKPISSRLIVVLAGVPVQHREVQGYESPLFLGYFPKLNIQEGGVDTGFKHVKPEEYRHRLFHVKGNKARVIVREVPKTFESLNSGDVFILDCGLDIYQFNGKESSGFEKQKAAEYCAALDSERKGKPQVHVINEDDGDSEPFWKALGSRGAIKSANSVTEDIPGSTQKKLLRLSDSNGNLVFKEEATGKITKSMFDPNDVFVFDAGTEVFVWVGKGASPAEKRSGIQYAQTYLRQANRPPYLPISKINDGGENETFMLALK